MLCLIPCLRLTCVEAVRELRKSLEDVDVLGNATPQEGDDEEEDQTEFEFKQWENSAGKKIKAAVREVEGNRVLFLLRSGKSVWYDISKLSESSQLRLKDAK